MQTNSRIVLRPCRRSLIVAAASLFALGAAPGSVTAQTYWRIPGSVGGAFVGAGVGWAVDIARWRAGDLGGPDLTVTPVAIGLGALVGFVSGLSADRRLARGDSLTRGGRAALRFAMFLTPVATGSAIAFAIINPSDDGRCVPYQGPDPNIICTYEPPPGKIAPDEMVALVAIGGGAVVGFLAQYRFARALWPRARVGLAPTGRGVMVSIPVDW
jgi:hypothetical protein